MLMLWLLLASLLALFFPVNFKRKPPVIPEDKKAFYAEYIQSSEWQKKRRQRLKLDKGKCVSFHLLPVRKGLHIHHKTYKRLGNESMKDLITLCSYHHRKEHRK